jgi:hypothetical protein
MSESSPRAAIADSVDRARDDALKPLPWPATDDDRTRSKELLSGGAIRYRIGIFYVDVGPDGRIMVNRDDWLSKYTMAIDGTINVAGKFARLRDGKQFAIENDNLIRTGEILLHLPTAYRSTLDDAIRGSLRNDPRAIDSLLEKVNEMAVGHGLDPAAGVKDAAEKEASEMLVATAKGLCPDVVEFEDDEDEKERRFLQSSEETIGILMYEFARGTGKELRNFDFRHAIVPKVASSSVGNEILQMFVLANRGKKPGEPLIALDDRLYSYSFSPDQTGVGPRGLHESLGKHVVGLTQMMSGDTVDMFLGGAQFKLSVDEKGGKLLISVYDAKSASSLMLHAVTDHPRLMGKVDPLGTTRQLYQYQMPIPWELLSVDSAEAPAPTR